MVKKYLFTVSVFALWILGFYLATNFSGEDFVRVLSTAPVGGVIAGFLFYCLAVGSGIVALYVCLRSVGLKPPLRGIGKAWIFGSFVDNIAPTVTPVGEASMAYFLEKFYRVSYTKSLAAIGIYVSSWGISVSIFAIVSVLLANYLVGIPSGFLPIVIIVIIAFFILTGGWLLLLTKKTIMRGLITKLVMLYYSIRNKVMGRKVSIEPNILNMEFERSYNALESVMKNKRVIALTSAIMIIPQIAHVLCLYVLLLGFGVEVSFFQVLTIQIVAMVAGLVSLIPSGLGVYEGASIGGLSLTMKISESAAFGAVFLYRLIFVWTTNLVGGIIGIAQGITDPIKQDKI